jgi:MSHA biogenesis protein MshJ
MLNPRLQGYYDAFENWLSNHSHRDRIYLAIAGFIVIYMLWYLLLEKSVLDKIDALNKSIHSDQQELIVFQNQINHINITDKTVNLQQKNAAEALKNSMAGRIPLASQKDNDVIIQTILTPEENVHFLRLDNTPAVPATVNTKSPVKNDVQLSFNSNYFATIHYLSQLEKLPWCLSWDSLEYKVVNYPDALVVINLHIVNS